MCKSYQRSCLRCGSVNTKKDGKRKGRQSYKCKKCNHIWITKSRGKGKINIDKLYKDFSIHKQTYKELGDSYKIGFRTVQKYLDEYVLVKIKIEPKSIILLIDTTYFGTFGIMVFKDSKTKKILNYKVVDYETNMAYRQGIKELIESGWKIKAIVCDGRRGLLGGFGEIPTQMCQFHQSQIIRRYVTKTPRLKPNKDLNNVVKWLTRTDKGTFKICLENWYRKHKLFIDEKGINSKGKEYYIHRKTRSAYFSLKRNFKYLFIYQDYIGKLEIPNTTNGIESLFSHLKYKVNLHRGLRKDRKLKLIISLLHV